MFSYPEDYRALVYSSRFFFHHVSNLFGKVAGHPYELSLFLSLSCFPSPHSAGEDRDLLERPLLVTLAQVVEVSDPCTPSSFAVELGGMYSQDPEAALQVVYGHTCIDQSYHISQFVLQLLTKRTSTINWMAGHRKDKLLLFPP